MKNTYIGWAYTHATNYDKLLQFACDRRISLLGYSSENVTDMINTLSPHHINVLIIDSCIDLCVTMRRYIYTFCDLHGISVVWYKGQK